jgi:hypothetical protein
VGGAPKRALKPTLLVEPFDSLCLDDRLEAGKIIDEERSNLGRGLHRGLGEARNLGDGIQTPGHEDIGLGRTDGAETPLDPEGVGLTRAIDGMNTLMVGAQTRQCRLIMSE